MFEWRTAVNYQRPLLYKVVTGVFEFFEVKLSGMYDINHTYPLFWFMSIFNILFLDSGTQYYAPRQQSIAVDDLIIVSVLL